MAKCRTLKAAMREHCSRSQVIWYDAVTTEGDLTWQNTLNALNRPFFDASDALFVNYSWKVTSTPPNIFVPYISFLHTHCSGGTPPCLWDRYLSWRPLSMHPQLEAVTYAFFKA